MPIAEGKKIFIADPGFIRQSQIGKRKWRRATPGGLDLSHNISTT